MDFLKTTHEEERIYQWDIDKVLEIIQPSGYEVKEVHFQHCNVKDAYVLEVYEEAGVKLVKIPNILLQSSAPIKAWLTDGERTICGQILTVIARAKPSDYVYTETEIKRYETLEARIEDLENSIKNGNLDVDLSGIEADIDSLQEDVSKLSEDKADKENTYTKAEVDRIVQNLPSGEGGNGSNKTLLGEVVVSGHKKIQPLAIDYTTGIITVDDCSFLPSESVVSYTASKVCIRKKTDAFYPNNVIPSELYSGIGIKKISDNTLYLYKAGTKLESYVETATIDLNAWYIEYSDVTHVGMSVDLSEIEYGNHLAIEVFSPCTEIKTGIALAVNVTDNDSVKYLSYGATNGIRATSATGGDDYAFDSIRSLSSTGNVIKGNAMPLRYTYDLKITEDFIYVEAKNIFTVSSNDDKLPVYSFGQKTFLIKNNGINKISATQGSNYLMLAEGAYLKIWEVHD